METLKAYIWDMDGTLIDSYGAIVSALAEVTKACGARHSPELILQTVKQGSVSGYLHDLSAESGKSTEALYQMYRTVGHANDDQIPLIPGAAETLKVLLDQGAKHFVYTHRGSTTRPLLERFGIRECFTEIVTSENGFRPKPSGEGVEYLLEKYMLDRMKTAYVGDRALDVLCAKDAGVQAILYPPPDSCVTPTGKEDRIVRELAELSDGEHLLACGKDYKLLRLLGHGKGGYSYLAEADGKQFVLKQIHHEACDYYTIFGWVYTICVLRMEHGVIGLCAERVVAFGEFAFDANLTRARSVGATELVVQLVLGEGSILFRLHVAGDVCTREQEATAVLQVVRECMLHVRWHTVERCVVAHHDGLLFAEDDIYEVVSSDAIQCCHACGDI